MSSTAQREEVIKCSLDISLKSCLHLHTDGNGRIFSSLQVRLTACEWGVYITKHEKPKPEELRRTAIIELKILILIIIIIIKT